MNDRPAWLRILDHCREFGFTIGPTLPFILGATQESIGKAPASRADGQGALHELLVAMDASGYGLTIQSCPTTMAYVVARTSGESLTWDEELGAGIEPLTANLWNRYGDAVSSGRYSKNGDWHEFTDQEVARIKAALQAER